jgi:hypothetical protein
MKSRLASTIRVAFAVFALLGCDREGPAERAGKGIDKAAEKVGDAIKT